MFDTTHYLHYVLDAETDYHYTDDLMRLSPDAYLWQELKEVHGFPYVIFVKKNDSGFALEVYDTGSGELLTWSARKKGFFESKTFSPPDTVQLRRRNFRLSDLGKQDSTLLDLLSEVQRNARNEKVALVYTPAALSALIACSSDGLSILREYAVNRKKAPNAISVVQIDMTAAALDRTFLQQDSMLTELDDTLAKALRGNIRKPLLTTLEEQLGERLIDFTVRQNDMLNILMYDALENQNDQDSAAQLSDQAEYLRLSCHYDLSIAYMLGSRGSEPRRRSIIYGKLQESTFRNALRSSAAKLRATNAEASMRYLFQQEFSHLPEVSSGHRVVYNDSLVKSATALTLPEAYLHFDDTLKRVPEELVQSVRTLWNRNRNDYVCDRIEEYCGAIYNACADEDWNAVTDALLLLRLCSRNICADTAMRCNLEQIFQLGSQVLSASAKYLQTQASYRDMEKLKKKGAIRSEAGQTLDTMQATMDTVNLEAERMMLDISRTNLRQCITFFNMQTRTQKEIEDFFQNQAQAQKEAIAQFEAQQKILQAHKPQPETEAPVEEVQPDTKRHSRFSYSLDEEDNPVEFDHSWRKYTGVRPPWQEDPDDQFI